MNGLDSAKDKSANSMEQWPALNFEPLPRDVKFKILFVYPNFPSLAFESMRYMLLPQMGLLSLSASVKRIGCDSALCDLTTVPPDLGRRVLRSKLEQYWPDLVAITALSHQWPVAAEMVQLCKRMGIAHLVGGPHASLCPEEVIEVADRLVVGEGEGALMDVARALATGRRIEGIPNVWARTANGAFHRQDRRRLISNLDQLPMPDWKLYPTANYKLNGHFALPSAAGARRPLICAKIEGSRGCPHSCTYCSNPASAASYRGKGRWRREKSAGRIIAELKDFREALGGLDCVHWIDDIFMTDERRLAQFCEAYRKEIGVPFVIKDRPENVTESKIKMMAECGLEGISIGVESGDEQLRVSVLNRKTTTEVLEGAFRIPKKYGVKTFAYNMVGLPGQDERSMVQTWKFMRKIKPDGVRFNIFHPIRGTQLYDECVRRGLYDPRLDTTPYKARPTIRHDLLDDETIIRYQRLLTAYASARGIWPALAFHAGRRFDWLYRLLMRVRAFRHRPAV